MGLLRCFLLSALVAGMGCRQVLGLEDVDCAPAYATSVDYPTAAGPRALGVGDLSVGVLGTTNNLAIVNGRCSLAAE